MTNAGSQLTFMTQNEKVMIFCDRGVTNDLGGGQGRNKQKRYIRGVTTDLGGGAGQE